MMVVISILQNYIVYYLHSPYYQGDDFYNIMGLVDIRNYMLVLFHTSPPPHPQKHTSSAFHPTYKSTPPNLISIFSQIKKLKLFIPFHPNPYTAIHSFGFTSLRHAPIPITTRLYHPKIRLHRPRHHRLSRLRLRDLQTRPYEISRTHRQPNEKPHLGNYKPPNRRGHIGYYVL